MHSTLKLRETDPHDIPAIAPDVIPAAWADKVLADITRDATSHPSDQPPPAASSADAAAPAVDTTFRATAVDDIKVAGNRPSTGRWARGAVTVFVFALCSVGAAVAWQHYGGAAKQMISDWAPPFALNASPPEKTGLAGQPDESAVQAAAADQTAPQPVPPAQPAEGVAPAAAALTPDAGQLLQSMAHDLAAMGQQIEQLKASIAELKAGQQPMTRDVAKSSEAKSSEARPSEVRASVQNPRPKPAPPPRSAAAPSRKPVPAYYSPVQAAAPLPQAAPPPTSLQPAPAPQTAARPEDEPVVRPPMPLR